MCVSVCVFICNWIKKRREPRENNVTLQLCRVREADEPLQKEPFMRRLGRARVCLSLFFLNCVCVCVKGGCRPGHTRKNLSLWITWRGERGGGVSVRIFLFLFCNDTFDTIWG